MSSEPKQPADPDVVIDVRAVTKEYRIYDRPIDRLKQSFSWGRRQYYRDFLALKDVDLQVRRGQMVGIIGRNGGGKSTLLQIIAGTLAPTQGEIRVAGRVAALLELGSGFDMEATGRENVMMNGSILGLSQQEIARQYDKIVAFADIGEFIDQPVKTYSSGMVVRLAFAVAAHVHAEVLIVDEALAVGDAQFQAKCFRRIEQMRSDGVTILLATHDMGTVAAMCDHALLLDRGEPVMYGRGKRVAEEYYRRARDIEITEQGGEGSPAEQVQPEQDRVADDWIKPKAGSGTRMGDGRAEIVGYAIYDHNRETTRALQVREAFSIEVAIEFRENLHNPHIGAGLRDVQSRLLIGGHTLYDGQAIGPVQAGERLVVSFDLQMNLNPGKYLLMLGVAEHQDRHSWQDCDVLFDLCQVQVFGKDHAWTLVDSPVNITIRNGTT